MSVPAHPLGDTRGGSGTDMRAGERDGGGRQHHRETEAKDHTSHVRRIFIEASINQHTVGGSDAGRVAVVVEALAVDHATDGRELFTRYATHAHSLLCFFAFFLHSAVRTNTERKSLQGYQI